MNTLIFNGAGGNRNGDFHRAVAAAVRHEAEVRGHEAAELDLDTMAIKPCVGCFACWLKHPGTCAIKDDEEPVLKAYIHSDTVVWLTPITFGGYSSALKKALDRLIPSVLPFFIWSHGEIHHPPRYERRKRLIVLGTLPKADEDAEKIFRDLVGRNAANLNSAGVGVAVITETFDPSAIGDAVRQAFAQSEVI